MVIQSETELYEPVKQYFEKLGYEVKGEVNGCDIVAIHSEEDEPIIIELKKTFNLALLFQGVERLSTSNQVYLAVQHVRGKKRPPHLRWSNIKKLCTKLGLGLITVQFYKTKPPHVEILCHPERQQSKKKTRRQLKLRKEFHERSGDYNVGGSTQTKIITAYRELALHCAFLLQQHEQLSPLQLREMTGKQKVDSILQKNYYGWFERVRRGVYTLTPTGEQALETYEQIVINNRWQVSERE